MNIPSQTCTDFDRFLQAIKIKNVKNEFYKGKERKLRQIEQYGKHIFALLKNMSKKRTLTFVDCCAGSAYLSFYLNYIFRDKNIRFVCIDYNREVINRAEETAFSLGFVNMSFICADLSLCELPENPDLVYSLHACDTATDMSLYGGIKSGAANILSVSCCQRHTYRQMTGHPLTEITKNKVYKERLADMIGDSMRSLVLESHGYKTDIFEFSSSSHTDKNVMLRAVKIPVSKEKRERARFEYGRLSNLFGMEPKLREFLDREEKGNELVLDVS